MGGALREAPQVTGTTTAIVIATAIASGAEIAAGGATAAGALMWSTAGRPAGRRSHTHKVGPRDTS